MGFIDIFIGALLVFAFYKGFKNGLFVELASFVAFFLGIFIAIKFSYIAVGVLEKSVSWSPKTITVVAFMITLTAVIVIIHLSAKLLSSIASFAFLGWANKLAGGTFGSLKTVLLIGILLSLFQKVNLDNRLISKETQESSLFINPCIKTSETLLPILTNWFKDVKDKTKSWEKKNDNSEVIKDSLQ